MCEKYLAGESAPGDASQALQSLVQVLIEDDVVEQAVLIYATWTAHSRWGSLPCRRSMGQGQAAGCPPLQLLFCGGEAVLELLLAFRAAAAHEPQQTLQRTSPAELSSAACPFGKAAAPSPLQTSSATAPGSQALSSSCCWTSCHWTSSGSLGRQAPAAASNCQMRKAPLRIAIASFLTISNSHHGK